MSTLKVLTQQIKLETIGITEVCIAHCLKCLSLCNAKDFHLWFSSLFFPCSSAISLKLPWPVFSRASLAVFFPCSGSVVPSILHLQIPKLLLGQGLMGSHPTNVSQHPLCFTWSLMTVRKVCLNIAIMNAAHDLCQWGTLLNWQTKETGEKH